MKTYSEFLAESELSQINEATKAQILDLMNSEDWKENEAVKFGIKAQLKGLVKNASTGAVAFQKHWDEYSAGRKTKKVPAKSSSKPSGLAYRPKIK